METIPTLSDITFILGRLEGKVDSLLVAHSRLDERTTVLENRVNVLDSYKAYLMGACAAISVAVSAAFYYFTNFALET